jgi:predicted secreted hydrolase
MRTRRAAVIATATIVGVAAVALFAVAIARALRPATSAVDAVRASLTVADALGGDTAGFRRVTGPRPFSFPDDHGPHPGYRTEWWYFVGNLADARGRRFGFQLTLFRNALTPESAADAGQTPPTEPAADAAWAAAEIYMGHFAVTDIDGRRFHAFERFARAAAGLAGATVPPLRVWLEDWQVHGDLRDAAAPDSAARVPGTAGLFPARVRAFEDGVGIDLRLLPGKPVVLQGEAGYARRGVSPGNASHYYSFTRLPTAGAIVIGRDTFTVRGESWLDREWSTLAPDSSQVGWDWFALQLDDGSDIMLYQLRHEDGTADVHSRGTWVDPSGAARPLSFDALTLDTLAGWTSPRGGRYPARWRLRIPDAALDVAITPLLADQEHDAYVRYWEGTVEVHGTRGGAPVSGRGYVELTGYATDG